MSDVAAAEVGEAAIVSLLWVVLSKFKNVDDVFLMLDQWRMTMIWGREWLRKNGQ